MSSPLEALSARSGRRIVLAATALALALGTVHAFSIFLEPMEARFAASRGAVSATYSLALVALTAGVLMGHRVYRRLPARRLIWVVTLAAAAGLLVAAKSSSLYGVWLGYSLIFGFANGLGYGYALHVAAQASPGRAGRAMGLVTAVYGLGAAVSPPLLDALLHRTGLATALAGLALFVLLAGALAETLVARTGFVFQTGSGQSRSAQSGTAQSGTGQSGTGQSGTGQSGTGQAGTGQAGTGQAGSGLVDEPQVRRRRRRMILLLWFGYGSAVTAGLMAIGHATGIAGWAGLTAAAVTAAPAILAAANMVGGLLGGAMLDRTAPAMVLGTLPLLSAFALLLNAAAPGGAGSLAALAATGFAYGATIAAYPAAIARHFGAVESVRIYGYVFTAWGTAGLLGPWMAGLLFDLQGSYATALLLAAAIALASSLAVWRWRRLLD